MTGDSVLYERIILYVLYKKSFNAKLCGREYFEDSLENIISIIDDVIDSFELLLNSPVSNSSYENSANKHTIHKNQCKYCMSMLSKKSHLDRHLLTCKMKDDPIRQLEIKANIEFKPPSPNTCRFCKSTFHNCSNLNKHLKICKEIKIYKEQLQLKIQQIAINLDIDEK